MFDKLGQGCVSLVDALLGAAYPAHNIRVVNMGTSGNTVLDLAGRWQTGVLDLKPDWLSMMIGANDVWRRSDSPRQPQLHALPNKYEQALDELVDLQTTKIQSKHPYRVTAVTQQTLQNYEILHFSSHG